MLETHDRTSGKAWNIYLANQHQTAKIWWLKLISWSQIIYLGSIWNGINQTNMTGYLPFLGLSVTWGSWQFDVRFMFRAMTISILKQTVVTLDLRHGWACSTQSGGFEMVSTFNLFENHQFLGLICIKEPSRSKGDWRETMIPRPNSSKYGVIWNPGPWQEWVLPFPFDHEVFILSKQGMRINLHLPLLLGGGASQSIKKTITNTSRYRSNRSS